MFSSSRDRVTDRTDPAVNEQIRLRMEMRLAYFQNHPERINQRLEELDREWDVERMLETGSSALTLGGLLLGVARSRKWLLVSLTVQVFFAQHAVQGWCPPLPVLRRLGFRTEYEIELERYALKALRGDFQELPKSSESRGTSPVLEAVRR